MDENILRQWVDRERLIGAGVIKDSYHGMLETPRGDERMIRIFPHL